MLTFNSVINNIPGSGIILKYIYYFEAFPADETVEILTSFGVEDFFKQLSSSW